MLFNFAGMTDNRRMYYLRSLLQGKYAELLSSLQLPLKGSFTEVKRRLLAEGEYSVVRAAHDFIFCNRHQETGQAFCNLSTLPPPCEEDTEGNRNKR